VARSEKRQRKKDAAVARRVAAVEAARRRRRRSLTLAAVTVLLLGGGTALALLFGGGDTNDDVTAAPTLAPAATPGPSASTVACGAKAPKASGQKPSYQKPTDQKLDPSQRYLFRLDTSCGRIDVELDLARAPKTSNSVAFLARAGFYDGLLFHRIVPGFALQGGDPKGDGTGGSGYSIVEAPPKDLKYTKGIVAMAKKGTDPAGTSESQFFVVPGDGAQALPAEYALLGKVAEGMEAVALIDAVGNANGAPPSQRVYIEKATIVVA
jgi:peptidyl-prolyl cis-trans isomerase B (cyclophilin B)